MNSFKVKNLDQKKDGKPSIFIGSSTESLVVARAIKSMFDPNAYSVDIWDEDIFDPSIQQGTSEYAIGGKLFDKGKQADPNNEKEAENAAEGETPTNLDSLKNFSDIYDFAIFVFVPDDKLVSQSRTHLETGAALEGAGARHNLVFEFGLFLGRIGSKKTFVVADETIAHFINNFFTDLKGISIYSYNSHYADWINAGMPPQLLPYDEESLEIQVDAIKSAIEETKFGIELGFLPSTALAIGYFENLLKLVVTTLHSIKSSKPPAKKLLVERILADGQKEAFEIDLSDREVSFQVVIPDELLGASHDRYKENIRQLGLLNVYVPYQTRTLTLFCHPIVLKEQGPLHIYDIPSTMFSSSKAIDLLTDVKDIRELLDEKEKQNFSKAVKYLIHADKEHAAILNEMVSIVDIKQVEKAF